MHVPGVDFAQRAEPFVRVIHQAPAVGVDDLYRRCARAHTIAGVRGADGVVGPAPNKVALRCYSAGSIANTPENMVRWIVNPKSVDEKTVSLWNHAGEAIHVV